MAHSSNEMAVYSFRIVREGYARELKDLIDYQYDNFSQFGWFSRGSVKELTHHSFDLVTERFSNLKEIGLHRLVIEKVPTAVLYVKRGLKHNYLLVGHSSLMHMTITYLFRLINEKQTHEEIKQLLDDFNAHPDQYRDKIDQINKQLDGVKEIMHKNIEQVLNRGEHIDNLMVKADHLSLASKGFYSQSKKLNRCCTIM